MTITKNEKRIVRLAARFLNRSEAIEQAWAESYERDSEFDGGEFSGPATRRAVDADVEDLARSFGFAPDVLRDLAHRYGVKSDNAQFLYEGCVELPL